MTTINQPLNRKLRMALIGGGGSAFIGRVHAVAATLDNRAELVAGVLSSDPQKSKQFAPEFGMEDDRVYGSYEELIGAEAKLPDDRRVDFISIATPNFTHFAIAKAALEAGFNVFCDKPMTIEMHEAKQLVELVEQTGAVFVLTHNYTGYPLVRQAAEMIRGGELGEVQAIRVHYIQGWLRGLDPDTTPARGAWKSDPVKSGSGTLGDLATHAFHLARFMSGLVAEDVSCLLKTYAPGRSVDDYGHALVRCAGDALVMISFSQVTHGRLNDLSIEIDGARGSLVWRQEDPNRLAVRRFGKPIETYECNPMAPYTNEAGRAASRLPGGHPEAFFEAFANIYRNGYDDIVARANNIPFESRATIYPNVYDGQEGVSFVQHCLASNQADGAWVPLTQIGNIN